MEKREAALANPRQTHDRAPPLRFATVRTASTLRASLVATAASTNAPTTFAEHLADVRRRHLLDELQGNINIALLAAQRGE